MHLLFRLNKRLCIVTRPDVSRFSRAQRSVSWSIIVKDTLEPTTRSSKHVDAKFRTKRVTSSKPAFLPLDKPFPTKAALKSPKTWASIIASVKDSGARRHSSLSKEMVWIFGLASHHNEHHDDFAVFCNLRNIKPPKAVTSASILQTMLLQYTGADEQGKKHASKYKGLLLPSLMKRLPVEAFERRIKTAGGVFGLATKKTTKQAVPKGPSNATAIVEEDGEYTVSMPVGETQTLVLKALHGPTTAFTLNVTSKSVRHGRIEFDKALEEIIEDDDEIIEDDDDINEDDDD
jgi:hypothetical protein